VRYRRAAAILSAAAVLALAGRALSQPVPANVAVSFSPGATEQALAAAVGRARSEVLVIAPSFSSRRVAQALLAAMRRKVRVRIVTTSTGLGDPAGFVAGLGIAGAPLRVHGGAVSVSAAVLDRTLVYTGPDLFAAPAQRIADAVEIRSPAVASLYAALFEQLWQTGVEVR